MSDHDALRAALWHQTAETLASALLTVAAHLPIFAAPPQTADDRRKAERVAAHYEQYKAAFAAFERAKQLDGDEHAAAPVGAPTDVGTVGSGKSPAVPATDASERGA